MPLDPKEALERLQSSLDELDAFNEKAQSTYGTLGVSCADLRTLITFHNALAAEVERLTTDAIQWKALAEEQSNLTACVEAKLSALEEALNKRAYVASENHLSGGRVIIGFDKLADAADAHDAIARLAR